MPYLGVVMPPLLTTAELKPDILVQDDSDSEDDEGEDDEVFLISFQSEIAEIMGFLVHVLDRNPSPHRHVLTYSNNTFVIH